MWYKYGKRICILFFTTIVIVSLVFVLGRYQRKNYGYREQTIAQNKDRILEIYNVEDYLEFANSVCEENDYNHWKIVLCDDLDFGEYDKIPVIGEMKDGEDAVIFCGKFEGNGHVIKNLHISNPEGNAAMFARLGGIVKNLQIKDCSFEGKICGAITAESYEAVILNCHVDAEVAGEQAGAVAGCLFGDVVNCMTSTNAVGELQYGEVKNSYIFGEDAEDALNDNLYHVSGKYNDSYLFRWETSDTCMLSDDTEDLLDTLTARMEMGEKEYVFQGFYSNEDEQWYVVLPATYKNTEVFLEAYTSNGGYEAFKKNKDEDTIIFTWNDKVYPIHFVVADNIESMYITLKEHKNLDYVHAHKEEKLSGVLTVTDTYGESKELSIKSFYGHGNDSWEAEKKSYNLKLASDYDLLGMGANEDFVLLAGYRMNSLMSYVTSAELVRKMGFDYAPEFRLVNLYVNGEYAGVYFLTEKIEIDNNRIDITNLYEKNKKVNQGYFKNAAYKMYLNEETKEKYYYYALDNNPEDITGGYLLEMDVADYGENVSRFITKGRKNKITLKRATYSSEEQVNYIATYWQEFEDALLSSDGINKQGKRYTEYIDLESFAMQWLMYELAQEGSMKSSIYYYKESAVDGDGLLHAVYPWDLERSYDRTDKLDEFWNVTSQGDYWAAFYQHEDFRNEVSRIWFERLIPAIEFMIREDALLTENGFKNLRWYEEFLPEIDMIENKRWEDSRMIEKCKNIRYILEVRNEVLTSIFAI